MPWINNEYIPSVYSKNELPTWDEVYNDFYKNMYYDPNVGSIEKWDKLDPYWRIPRWKYLWATVCNQFNKNVFEDHLYPEFGNMEMCVNHVWCHDHVQYYIPNPNGIQDPFAIYHPGWTRFNINDVDFEQLQYHWTDGDNKGVVLSSDPDFMRILNIFMAPFVSYFENGVGWKDNNGQLVESDNSRACLTGFDPAL